MIGFEEFKRRCEEFAEKNKMKADVYNFGKEYFAEFMRKIGYEKGIDWYYPDGRPHIVSRYDKLEYYITLQCDLQSQVPYSLSEHFVPRSTSMREEDMMRHGYISDTEVHEFGSFKHLGYALFSIKRCGNYTVDKRKAIEIWI